MSFFNIRNAFLGVILLSSCNVSMPKQEQVKNIIAPPSLQKSICTSMHTPFFTRSTWPKDCWWSEFHAPDLNCLIASALSKNPTIQEVRERIELARQESIVVRAKLFPLVFFEYEDTKEYVSHNGLYRAFNPKFPISANLVDLSIGFTYEFDFWGQNANLFAAALGREQAAKAESAEVILVTTTALAQSYFALKTNLIRRELYLRLYRVRKDAFELQQLLLQKALLSKLDPLLSEELVLEAGKLVASIEEEIAVNKHVINTLAGRGPDECLNITECLSPIPEKIAIPCDVSLNLLARRPDLMATIWRAEALAHEVGAAMADYYPNINLAGLVGVESALYSQIFQARSITASVTPALYLPIFTAGAIGANIRARKADFNAAIYAYNQLLLDSAREVADLLALGRSVYEQKALQNLVIERSKQRYELTVLRKEKGLDNFLAVYQYLEELIDKELEDVTLIYNQYLVTIKLIKALGGGYHAECIPLKKYDN
ncbi:MAG: efflux transporter outer membrane subunit [Chlamydiales bacterium]|nr:efflux transporter outer membrane subunit [Chlamydiales bacterium]